MQNELFSLYTFLQGMVSMTDEAWTDVKQRLQPITFAKREIFAAEGKVCRHISFVTRGSSRYYKMMDGVDITTYFSFENDWISDYTSFLMRAPGTVSVEAMEESEVLMLSYDDMQGLYHHHAVWERFGRLMAEYLITCLDKHMSSLLLSTPEERYLKVLQDSPTYFERVPQHYIASYLGVTPESLSRIRRRVMHKAIS